MNYIHKTTRRLSLFEIVKVLILVTLLLHIIVVKLKNRRFFGNSVIFWRLYSLTRSPNYIYSVKNKCKNCYILTAIISTPAIFRHILTIIFFDKKSSLYLFSNKLLQKSLYILTAIIFNPRAPINPPAIFTCKILIFQILGCIAHWRLII